MDNTEIRECRMADYYWKEKMGILNIITKLNQQSESPDKNKYLISYREEYEYLNARFHENMDICRLLNGKNL